MAARIGLNGSPCITPVLFSMEMERALGPIRMVPHGFKGGAIEFAGFSAGRPKRQPLVRIDGGKQSAEFVYKSAAVRTESADTLLGQIRELDAFMDEKVLLPGEAKFGRRVFNKEMSVRQLAGMGRKNMQPEIAEIIKGAYRQVFDEAESNPESPHLAKGLFNSAALAFALSGGYVSKFNSAELFLDSAKVLFKDERFTAAAIAGEYAQDLFGTLEDQRSLPAGALVSDAWLRSVEEFKSAGDYPGFLIAVRYGLLSAMKAGDSSAMEKFHYEAARHYEARKTGGSWTIASNYALRAAISVLQKSDWKAEDWRQVSDHLHRARRAVENAFPMQRARVKDLSALQRIAEEMSGR